MAENLPRLRLMHIDLGEGWAGGQTQSFALTRGLAERGHEVTFVGRRPGEIFRRLEGAPLNRAPLAVSGRGDFAAVLQLRRLILGMRPQIVHCHDSLAFWLGGLAAKFAGRPLVIVHKRTDHAPGGMAKLRYHNLADYVIAISGAAESALLGAGVSPDKIRLIYSSIDSRWFKPDDGEREADFRRKLGLSPDWPLVGSAAVLNPRKGLNYLLEAASRVLREQPETRFVICGEGPERAVLEAQARRLGLEERVLFLGEQADVRPLLASLAVFVLPSVAEGLGVAVLEAMAMGRPVVASKVGGLAELVADGVTGFLVEPRQPPALAERIIRLLGEGELGRRFGREARRRVEEHFSREGMLLKTETLYYEALQRKGRL
jgi:glycosyltransferase involved in cell wall biosynthesis